MSELDALRDDIRALKAELAMLRAQVAPYQQIGGTTLGFSTKHVLATPPPPIPGTIAIRRHPPRSGSGATVGTCPLWDY